MSEDNTIVTALPLRVAATKMLELIDDYGLIAMGEHYADLGRMAEALSASIRAEGITRRHPLPMAELARGGIDAIRGNRQVSPEQIVGILEAAEHGLDEDRAFALRWAADMRAVQRWRDAAPAGEDRSLILPDHADLVVWLLEAMARPAVDLTVEAVEELRGRLARAIIASGGNRLAVDAKKTIDALIEMLRAAERRAFMAEAGALPADLEACLVDALAVEVGGSLDCTREWSAWSVGTMSEDDFEPLADRVPEIAVALASKLRGGTLLPDPDLATGSADDDSPLGRAVGAVMTHGADRHDTAGED